jgi:hypothetical protein
MLGFAAGVNFYAYVLNSPVKFSDPYGLDPWDIAEAPMTLSLST